MNKQLHINQLMNAIELNRIKLENDINKMLSDFQRVNNLELSIDVSNYCSTQISIGLHINLDKIGANKLAKNS